MDRTSPEEQEDRGATAGTNVPGSGSDADAAPDSGKGASGDAEGITGGYGTGGVPPQDQSGQ